MSRRLYKYKAVSEYFDEKGNMINRDLDNLFSEQLWVSSLEGMNDPLECGFYLDKAIDLSRINLFQKTLLRSYACLSFSTSVTCRRLWNYYTDGMRGMVLEYSDSSIRAALKRDSIISKKYIDSKEANNILEGEFRNNNTLVILPDCRRCISSFENNTLIERDLITGEIIHVFAGHSGPITSLIISPDGSILVSGSADNTIRIWDVKTGILFRILEGHTEPITSLGLHPIIIL